VLNRLCDGDRIALLQFGCSHNDDFPLSETCAASAAVLFHTSSSLLLFCFTSSRRSLRFVCAVSIPIAHTSAESASAPEDNSENLLRVQLSSPAHVPDDGAVARMLRMFNRFSLSFFSLPSLKLPRPQIHRNIGTGTARQGQNDTEFLYMRLQLEHLMHVVLRTLRKAAQAAQRSTRVLARRCWTCRGVNTKHIANGARVLTQWPSVRRNHSPSSSPPAAA
jgi:hypothetical protein